MSAANRLPPGQQLAAPGKWPIVGERAASNAQGPWTVQVDGLVERPRLWTLEQLAALPRAERSIDVHCVTRWTKLGMTFAGVPLQVLLAESSPLPTARYVSFIAQSERNHSTSLPLHDCLELDVLVALEAEGNRLEPEHGGPVRIVTPGRYFYKSLKWLRRIELLAEDRLGYWEDQAGYHNVADPWLEQRYLASTVNKREAARVIAARDFRGHDLRGIHAQRRNLRQLQAAGSLLRDANFRGADLREANFDQANLSNAHCEGADLRGASLQGTDLEGANLEGADLRGANLAGASLFGATFYAEHGARARIDRSTRIDRASCDQLTPAQAEYVRAQLLLPGE